MGESLDRKVMFREDIRQAAARHWQKGAYDNIYTLRGLVTGAIGIKTDFLREKLYLLCCALLSKSEYDVYIDDKFPKRILCSPLHCHHLDGNSLFLSVSVTQTSSAYFYHACLAHLLSILPTASRFR